MFNLTERCLSSSEKCVHAVPTNILNNNLIPAYHIDISTKHVISRSHYMFTTPLSFEDMGVMVVALQD